MWVEKGAKERTLRIPARSARSSSGVHEGTGRGKPAERMRAWAQEPRVKCLRKGQVVTADRPPREVEDAGEAAVHTWRSDGLEGAASGSRVVMDRARRVELGKK